MTSIVEAPATMTSTELLEIVNAARKEFGEPTLRPNVFADRIKAELDGEHYKSFVVQNLNNTESTVFELTRDQCMLVAMRESKGVRRKVLAKLKDAEQTQLKPPVSSPARIPTPIETEQQLEALKRVMGDDELKKAAPVVWQHISDAIQNQALAFLGIPNALPSHDKPSLLDIVEIAKRNGIDIPSNLKSSAGKYVKARVEPVAVERIINGSIRNTFAYADHEAVAQALNEYLASRTRH
ncbi:hypothetical protein [Azorhizophilus paspali]|uniref:hypothetical protein n=1 Tax=Azorhizophilus paspali TaxID=69963 RepID=UPI0037485690